MRTDLLLYKAARELQKKYTAFFREAGHPDLTFTQFIVLRELWESPDGVLSEKDLCRSLSLDSGTLTPVLKNLERNGIIIRSRSAKDERVVNAGLTKKGADMRFHVPYAAAAEDDALASMLARLLESDAE